MTVPNVEIKAISLTAVAFMAAELPDQPKTPHIEAW